MRIGTTILICLIPIHASVTRAEPLEPAITDHDRSHWAFKPLLRPEIPPGTSTHPIDRFLDHARTTASLQTAPLADRYTLARRLSFDLTGLPPDPQRVADFVADTRPDAYERLADEWLASRAYAERWAQHWLDQARFAETDGFEHDKLRPDAWRYRDWVIQALDQDMPYDRFVQWQIAADELVPDNPEAAIATGFLLAGPDFPDINDQNERRHVRLNEIAATTGSVFMGLTLQCAECHDHKYDPLSQADFYRFRSVFSNMVWPKRDKPLGMIAHEPGTDGPDDFVMVRGDFKRPGTPIEPGVPRITQIRSTPLAIDALPTSSGRRKAFAQWLTQPDHPLTSRVMVNWLWAHHFGHGLSSTPGDFGRQGEAPDAPATARLVGDGTVAPSVEPQGHASTHGDQRCLPTIKPPSVRIRFTVVTQSATGSDQSLLLAIRSPTARW